MLGLKLNHVNKMGTKNYWLFWKSFRFHHMASFSLVNIGSGNGVSPVRYRWNLTWFSLGLKTLPQQVSHRSNHEASTSLTSTPIDSPGIEVETACVNKLGPGKNGRHLVEEIFKCSFFKERICILMGWHLQCLSLPQQIDTRDWVGKQYNEWLK